MQAVADLQQLLIDEFDYHDRTIAGNGFGAAFEDTYFPPLDVHLDEIQALEAFVGGETVEVSLVEWAVESPIELIPGVITFDVTNDGDFAHHFAIARGESYETLPQLPDGSIDEANLGADFLGRTSNMQGGGAETIEFDLEAGNYVFFCNIATAVSHAAQGQVLSVTVADVAL